MKRTCVDAGVLIAAARGQASIAVRAFEILDDPDREFAASVFLKLEVLPKAIYHNNSSEVEFYEEFFSAVTAWAADLNTVVDYAYREACDSGLAALDALHVAAAVSVGAEELVTSEKPDKPLFRIQSIKVVSIWRESIR
jgi:predicted nucleic acid-binding protein